MATGTGTVEVVLHQDEISRLATIGTITNRSSMRVAADWIRERLYLTDGDGNPRKGGDLGGAPGTAANEALRDEYRPEDVLVLVVGESAPANGTFFYRADSNLFYATREAFQRAIGPMPEGEAFLGKFKEMGFWLWDFVGQPVNHQRGRPRKDAVSQGVSKLAQVLTETEPDTIIGVKASLEGPVRQAALLAGIDASRVLILPFPLYQWREEYVDELAKFLNPRLRREESTPPSAGRRKLHEAITIVLAEAGGGPLPGRQIANEVVRRELFQRLDGSRPDYQQIILRAKKYPNLFEVGPSGISLKQTPGGAG